MSLSKEKICNTALIMIGADEINSFSDNTAEAKLCNAVYKETKESLLQYHPWRFTLRQIDLGGALVGEPLFGWKYRYQLPSDLLRIISIESNADYEIYQDRIHTNASPCKIVYQFNVLENNMPSYFVVCLQYHLAKKFAMSLQEDSTKMQLFERTADRETGKARSIDSQQQPNSSIPDRNYSFLNVRG